LMGLKALYRIQESFYRINRHAAVQVQLDYCVYQTKSWFNCSRTCHDDPRTGLAEAA
jgi:hypothetical protein